ncbi:hypothetical protein RB628_39885 [Streptomyces sp. ADMS]|nr:hypothetical protein [Streptomyces sp. ADMS]MDW4911295.1 hypothetical protein [Streptomyces sp. ADMS]
MTHTPPRKKPRELHTLVRSLDRTMLSRVKTLQVDHPDERWWRGQL